MGNDLELLIVRPAEPDGGFSQPPAIGATAAYVLVDLGADATLARCELRYLGRGRARITDLSVLDKTGPGHTARLLRGVAEALQATGIRIDPDQGEPR